MAALAAKENELNDVPLNRIFPLRLTRARNVLFLSVPLILAPCGSNRISSLSTPLGKLLTGVVSRTNIADTYL
jgi:hypothetical protein